MHSPWIERLLLCLELGIGAAFAFVVSTYVVALLLTRGGFGWPGLSYFLRETLWVCITQSLLPFGWVSRARVDGGASSSRGKGRRPIVLVHGYTQNRTNFVWLERHLGRRGLGPFFGFDYQSFARIESSAHELSAFVSRVLAATGAPEVDLVCHSLGGLVARTYVDLLGGGGSVRRIVTLGTPHRGIAHAVLAVGASVRDMHPPTGFIARLDGAAPSAVEIHSIFSTHDNIVFPSSASTLGARGTDVVVRQHGHFGILFSEEVAEHVTRALGEEVAAAREVTVVA